MILPITTIMEDKYIIVSNVENAAALAANVKNGKVIRHRATATDVVVMPYTLKSVQDLQMMDVYAPAPIHRDYKFTGRHPPFNHQRETVDFLVRHRRALVLSDMGTGKTAAALWAADYLMRQKQIRRAIIVCPLSCVSVVWETEVFNWVPHRNIAILHDERDARKYMARRSLADFMVINHDGFKIVTEELTERGDIDLLIYDEGAALRNPTTDRYKVVRNWVDRNKPWLWILTGTPTPNAPTDAWTLGRLVNPHGTPTSFTRFRDAVMWKASSFKWVPRNNSKLLVRQILQPAIRHRKEDCIDLPPTTHTSREVSMSTEQVSAFRQMKKDQRALAMQEVASGVLPTGKVVTAINAATKLLKLLQICSGSVYADDGSVADLPMNDRLAVLQELIEQSSNKVIVYITFRHTLRRVHEWLTKQNITTAMIHGGVGKAARIKIFQQFQTQDDPKVLLAQPRTASHGLNLTCADTIIWFTPTFSAEQYQQANERMARPGQMNSMTIAHLGAHPVEWGAYELVRGRQATQSALLALYEKVFNNDD